MLAGATSLVTHVDDWFTFDDWRDMLKGTELPFLKAFVALLAAYFVYVIAHRAGIVVDRWLAGIGRLRGLRWIRLPVQAVLILAAAACLWFAAWPFWGWGSVSKNVFARCVEFNQRHTFELQFLHWAIDCDRDGYAAVLHGADPDDLDPQLQPGGLGPPADVVIPVDHFAIDDAAQCPAVAEPGDLLSRRRSSAVDRRLRPALPRRQAVVRQGRADAAHRFGGLRGDRLHAGPLLLSEHVGRLVRHEHGPLHADRRDARGRTVRRPLQSAQ